jgi:hypothetical protein
LGNVENLEAVKKIQAKVDKGATKAFADCIILEQHEVQLLAYKERKAAAASKKKSESILIRI